ncbi:hypothetical protein [Streptomyces sp. AF1A]|uniref:hypothetical protein n=1 Tax=Streptomyces sp. AF1A TaxID=3394350 RepID=UPI0039BC7DBC
MTVGWQAANHTRTELPLDALEMALRRRRIKKDSGLIHHSDRGSHYVSTRSTDRLAESLGTTAAPPGRRGARGVRRVRVGQLVVGDAAPAGGPFTPGRPAGGGCARRAQPSCGGSPCRPTD